MEGLCRIEGRKNNVGLGWNGKGRKDEDSGIYTYFRSNSTYFEDRKKIYFMSDSSFLDQILLNFIKNTSFDVKYILNQIFRF